ncbi:exonuclease domain-containing protein [Rhodonellum sp.]|uniref:exonuclease domain-containing protein n=1 Tax=Rhodonellum sp. TaxID=2231180 RepID=UPI002727B26A|nr:exonuclease domain-containing protein [Rhodonellum sp.]MDO9553303.1 exonuclease domain-containing protein [Rhodonellum sp.]
MENHFFAIDVETANADYSSICQIGIAEFMNGDLIGSWKTYVNPEQYFDEFFTSIHGIDEEKVQNAPKIPEIMEEVSKMLKGHKLIHHMPFDRCSLNRACENYLLNHLDVDWMDSAKMVRRHWSEFSSKGYGLGKICGHLGINFTAHDALEDAIAAGKVVSHILIASNITLGNWLIKIEKPITPRTYGGTYVSFKTDGNPEGPLYGESVVFTGTLSRPRAEMAQIAAHAGCNVSDGVNKETTILVVGFQTAYRLAGYDKSSKQRKAELLKGKGQSIQIFSEEDFKWMADLQ